MFESRQIYPCLLLSCALKIRKMNENRNRPYWYLFLCCKQLAAGYRESEMIFWTLSGQNSLVKRQTKNQTNKESNKTRLSLKRVEKHSLSGVFFDSFSFYFSACEVDISIIWVLQMRAVNAFLGQDFIYEWVEFMWHGQGQSHQRKETVHVISDPFRNIKTLRRMFLRRYWRKFIFM